MVRRLLLRAARGRLPAGYDVDRHFSPRYDPWDQRLCVVPDGDLFTAVARGRASVVTDTVDTFTERGVRLGSGEELAADVVVTATGLNLLALGGMTLTVDGAEVELPDTVAYKGMMLSGVPNFAMTLGYTNASWTLKADLVATYVCRLLRHLDRTGQQVVTPLPPPDGELEPIIDLTAGYVLRSVDALPKQGARAPWRLHQNYPRDVLLMRHGRLTDPGVRFSRAGTPNGGPPVRRFVFIGGTAVVTGAASGIGEALVHGLARRGSDLVLVDRDAGRLDAVVAAVRAAHPDRQLTAYVVDLADAAATARVAEEIRRRHPALRLLVNNAGVALGGRFDQVSLDEFSWVVDVNFRAVAQLTHALLPTLRVEPGAHLVNVSSLFGIIAPAGQTAYAASKFAVRGFTEALRQELAGEGIGVTCVHPGGIRTRIAQNARVGAGVPAEEFETGRRQFEKLLTIDPARAAEVILRGVHRRRGRVLIGWSAKLPDLLARVAPVSYQRVVAFALDRVGGESTRRLTTGSSVPAQRQPEAAPAADPAGEPA